MAQHNRLGSWGERLAVEHLQREGYTICQTNWRSGKLELDIVAEWENLLIIVEVKTRANGDILLPFEAITPTKIRRIVQATDAYIRLRGIDRETRFDVISIIGSNESDCNLEHIVDAFLPTL